MNKLLLLLLACYSVRAVWTTQEQIIPWFSLVSELCINITFAPIFFFSTSLLSNSLDSPKVEPDAHKNLNLALKLKNPKVKVTHVSGT